MGAGKLVSALGTRHCQQIGTVYPVFHLKQWLQRKGVFRGTGRVIVVM